MKIQFVAGFGPITTDPTASRVFWGDRLGLPLEENGPDYFVTDALDGAHHFAIWSLADAAESCFGSRAWPENIPAPQAWIELDVQDSSTVAAVARDLEAAGLRLLRRAAVEEWGQTVARLLSPEGLLVGISYTPWLHEDLAAGTEEDAPGSGWPNEDVIDDPDQEDPDLLDDPDDPQDEEL